MINETDWTLRRKKSSKLQVHFLSFTKFIVDVISEYAQNNNETDKELSTKSSQILELMNIPQQ